jgi:hypothetical protein
MTGRAEGARDVIDELHALDRTRDVFGVADVALDQIDARCDEMVDARGRPHERPHGAALAAQSERELATDVAARARDQHNSLMPARPQHASHQIEGTGSGPPFSAAAGRAASGRGCLERSIVSIAQRVRAFLRRRYR